MRDPADEVLGEPGETVSVPAWRNQPVSTYRLQLHRDFGFAEAAAVAGYLAALGVTHVYLSPILQAAPGSLHGYDVVDHSRISAELGGEDGFRAMVAEFRRHDLGVVADIVPNHMGIAAPESLNWQFWSVLRDGAGSSSAHWFDVEWARHGGRLLLPILAGPPEECVADITVDRGDFGQPDPDGEPVLRYFDHVLPLRPGTAELPLAELLTAQHYVLADYRDAATQLNWRRFFDITSLIAIQVQEADVFAATHGLILGLAAEGLIDGLRVDHPDGLADPRGYLRRLATATSGAWVVTEKILGGDERLPADWACAGTTGYDSLNVIGGLFLDPAGAEPLTREYVRFTGGPERFAEVALAAKTQIAGGSLAAEVQRLVRVAELAAQAGEPTLDGVGPRDLRAAVTELLAAVSVYRAYVVPGESPPRESVTVVMAAAQAARDRLPGRLHKTVDALAALVLSPDAGGGGVVRAELAIRFQQTCGPVMAKGVEDTAFYRWSRLTALNEVGGEPGRLGISVAEFHAFAGRLARDWPATMTTLSTHDTKRGEDLRARLAVLSERPDDWAREVARWHDRAVALSDGGQAGGGLGGGGLGGGGLGGGGLGGGGLGGGGLGGGEQGGGELGGREQGGGGRPEPDTEYLLWQTLAGAWPVGTDRITQYLRKAMREAKTRTSWASPDDAYEAAAMTLARSALADADLSGRIAAFVATIDPDARVNSLGAKLVQLTMPGIPDLYQGCELGEFSLVDPDNRRPVDFDARGELLSALDNSALARDSSPDAGLPDDAGLLDIEKLLITSRALRLRRHHPDWFAGSYQPLAAEGPAAGHIVAFARGGRAVTIATRLPAGLRERGGWAGTVLPLAGLNGSAGLHDPGGLHDPAGPGGPHEPGRRDGPDGHDGPVRAWRDVLTNTVHAGPRLDLGRLTERLPVALLVPEPVAKRPDQVF